MNIPLYKFQTFKLSFFFFLSVLIESSFQFWQNTSDLVMELANPKTDKADHVLNFTNKLHKWAL